MSQIGHLFHRCRLAAPLLCAAVLAACGGGGDAPAAGASVAAAPLVVTAASPAAYNGTLDKSNVGVESGSSNVAMTVYAATETHCRVAVYGVKNTTSNAEFFVELSFKKDSKVVGLMNLGTGIATPVASATGPLAGVVVDIANRRVGFTNVVLSTGGTTVTLNGSLEYTPNIDPTVRPSCG